MTEGFAGILILAAGASRRMRGADKLLERVDGEAQLRRIARTALGLGAPVYVALPPDRPLRRQALDGLSVRIVEVADAATGMAASIRAGVEAMTEGAVMILLADMPELTTEDLAAMIAEHRGAPGRIARATSAAGQPGHPVIFPAESRPALLTLTGDTGARDLIASMAGRTLHVALPHDHAVTDLDTPEAWAAWRG